MTIDEILSHLSDEDANVVQRAISSLCEMITIREIYYNGGVYSLKRGSIL